MIIDKKKNLEVLIERLIPDKYSGTTFEKVVKNFLKNISKQHQYIDHFTNRFDIEKIETSYNQDELNSYVSQYTAVLEDILNIEYPNLLTNGTFANGCQFFELKTEIKNPLDNSKLFISYTDKDSFNRKNITFLYDAKNRFFKFTKVEHDFNEWNYLIQNNAFNGTKNKYEVSFEIEEIDSSTILEVYCVTNFENLQKVNYDYVTNEKGKHKFRIDLNNYILNDDNNLTFRFNGSVKLKYLKVTEFDRIDKEDIQILSTQIIQNKGRLGLYTLLFNLLQNLGSDSNTSLFISINENEVIGTDTKPRINISEVYQNSKSNIKYGDIKDGAVPYSFAGQDFYETGHAFKEYVTTYNSDKVIPFLYRIDATFSQDVFDQYILPIAHPTGWEIWYNIYKLIELTDKYNASNFVELDQSTYEHNILFWLNSSKQKVYDFDDLPIQTEIYKDINLHNLDIDTINNLSETENFYQKDSMFDNIDLSFFSKDTFFEIPYLEEILSYYDSEVSFKNVTKSPVTNEVFSESKELVYGASVEYDFGDELEYNDDETYETLRTDSISVRIIPNVSYDSSVTGANLFSNISIVKKVMNYGVGIDNNFYLYLGATNTGINLTTIDYETSPSWFNLDKRVPV